MIETDCSNKIQILTSFPNMNSKHIDYIIFYELFDKNDKTNPDKIKAERKRKQFFLQLKRESFEICNIEQQGKDGQKYIFALLHCPLKRLMKEAELMRIEMRLKNVKKIKP